MNDELNDKVKELANLMGQIMEKVLQRLTRTFNYLAIQLRSIRPRYKYHTKRVAIRKMQLRRLRKRCAIS